MTSAGFARDLQSLYDTDDLTQLRRRLSDRLADRGFWGVCECASAQQVDRRYFDVGRHAWDNLEERTGGQRDELLHALMATGTARGSEEENRRLRWRAAQKRPYLTLSGTLKRFPAHEDLVNVYRDFRLSAVDSLVVPLPGGHGAPRRIWSVMERKSDLRNAGEVAALISAYHLISRLYVADNDNRPTLARPQPATDREIALTEREQTVLRWAAAGKTQQDIAVITGLSARNVRYHMDRARDRYGFATTQQAIVRAAQDYGFDPLG